MGNIRRGIVTFTKAQCSASVATVADFALTIVLAKFCHMWYADATLLGAIFGGIVNCSINYRWVFHALGMKKKYVALRHLCPYRGFGHELRVVKSHRCRGCGCDMELPDAACLRLSRQQTEGVIVKRLKLKTMNYRDFLQKVIYVIINPLIKGMIKVGITPNMVTTIGFIGNIVAAAFFIDAAWKLGLDGAEAQSLNACMKEIGWGGFIIIAAGLFDMMDGRLARMSGQSSLFGALWDSTLDRYSELVSLFGICLAFIRMEDGEWFWMGVVTFAAMIGSVMVSYVRARAEGLDIDCKVGFMQRPERVVVTAATAIITGITGNIWWLAGGMLLIAVLANITAFWRIAHCYKVMNKMEKK